MSKSIVKPQDYDQFWIRYKPERVALKESGKLAVALTTTTFIFFVMLVATTMFSGLSPFTCTMFFAWLMSFLASAYLAPNYLFRYLYPTHIQLCQEGIRYHWLRHWIQASSAIVDWDRVSHVTTSDKKVLNTLSVEVEFNIQAAGMSPLDRLLFLLQAPAMSRNWLLSDRPILKVNINGIASSDDRKRLQLGLKKFLPSYRIEPKVADDLNMYIKFDSYTDIWLETLTSSKNRSLETALPIDTRLSNDTYRIVEEIGAGGEALIYKAELLKPIPSVLGLDGVTRNETMIDMTDLNMTIGSTPDRPNITPLVVLKEFVLPAQAGLNARQRVLDNIRQEAILWRKMRHPNIVRLLDFFAEDHRAYIVLEYMEGKSLKALVNESEIPFSEPEVVDMALVMCDILAHLHRKVPPIVHRDFTPDNLILDSSSILKLTDFNIALQLEAETTKTVAGKHAYIPPEQFRGEAIAVSDIYAFGCTINFLITGKEPEALSLSSPQKSNAKVSEALNSIVEKCTEQTIANRYQSINDVKSDLIKLKVNMPK